MKRMMGKDNSPRPKTQAYPKAACRPLARCAQRVERISIRAQGENSRIRGRIYGCSQLPTVDFVSVAIEGGSIYGKAQRTRGLLLHSSPGTAGLPQEQPFARKRPSTDLRPRPMLFLLEDACGRTMLPRRPTEARWEAGFAGRLSSRLWELAWQANRFTRLLSRARPAPTGKTQD